MYESLKKNAIFGTSVLYYFNEIRFFFYKGFELNILLILL